MQMGSQPRFTSFNSVRVRVMSKITAITLLGFLAFFTPRASADNVVLVVKSGTIATTKANGSAWDFPLVGKKALPDPYVKAWVYNKEGVKVDFGQTEVVWDSLTPVWNRDLVKMNAGQRVKIEVWDKDFKYDDLIGEHTFMLTAAMIKNGTINLSFGQVRGLRFDVRAEANAKAESRLRLQQPFPGPNSAADLTRTKDRRHAVVLLHGLDPRDDGGSPADPRFVDWQGSTSPLVKVLSRHADIFAISYAQTTAVEEIAAFPELRDAIAKVKRLGYDEVVLLGHSAGGLVARHFVEDHPQAGVTKVIQIATPNAGVPLAGWGVTLKQVPRAQEPFVQSLAPAHREAFLKTRTATAIPPSIEFVTVVTCISSKANGDGIVNRKTQWPIELQRQGIPCICLQASHLEVMAHDDCLDVYCKLITERQPRWSGEQGAAVRGEIEPNAPIATNPQLHQTSVVAARLAVSRGSRARNRQASCNDACLKDSPRESNSFDLQFVLPHERQALVACEHARRCADGADAARPEGTGKAQTILGVLAFQHAADVAGVERVAAPRRIDERHRVDARRAA